MLFELDIIYNLKIIRGYPNNSVLFTVFHIAVLQFFEQIITAIEFILQVISVNKADIYQVILETEVSILLPIMLTNNLTRIKRTCKNHLFY